MSPEDLDRLAYLINACPGFLPTRDQWEEIMKLTRQAIAELHVQHSATPIEQEQTYGSPALA